MSYCGQPGVHVVGDASVSEYVEQWVGEQLQRDGVAKRDRPHIGLVAYSSVLRDGGWPVYGADAPTAHAILEAGGFPCPIPLLPLLEGYDPLRLLVDDYTFVLSFEVLWPLVRDLDGLVLSGGSDLSACLSGRQTHPQAGTPDPWRDMWEYSLARLAWVLCLPTLGICRGMQLMNVAQGGTLYQDLAAQWPRDRPRLLRHRARGRPSSSNWVSHPVHLLQPESRLAQAVKGSGEPGRAVLASVLSMHHQAIEELAPGLVVSATAPDGVIEAIEDRSAVRWWVATQFHPEWCTHLAWVMGLFTAFVGASRAYSAVSREEIEPLREEIREWLRRRDRATLPGRTTTAVPRRGEADVPETAIIPVSRRTAPLLHPVGEAM